MVQSRTSHLVKKQETCEHHMISIPSKRAGDSDRIGINEKQEKYHEAKNVSPNIYCFICPHKQTRIKIEFITQ